MAREALGRSRANHCSLARLLVDDQPRYLLVSAAKLARLRDQRGLLRVDHVCFTGRLSASRESAHAVSRIQFSELVM